jgi:exocyst complex component 5
METKMNEVGRTAIRVGEELETVHQQRQRAQAAYDLIDFYNQFSRDDTSRMDALKKEGKEGRRQVAILLRRLGTVAKEVDLPNSEKVCDMLCEQLQTSKIIARLAKILTGTVRSSRKICCIFSIGRTAVVIPR